MPTIHLRNGGSDCVASNLVKSAIQTIGVQISVVEVQFIEDCIKEVAHIAHEKGKGSPKLHAQNIIASYMLKAKSYVKVVLP